MRRLASVKVRNVLGGQVVNEIDEYGGLWRTFVYAGPAVLGWLWHTYNGALMTWEQRDPSGASVRGNGEQELDPLGADAGTFANSVPPTERAIVSYGASYNPAHPNFTYWVDGVRVPVESFVAFGGFKLRDPLGLLEEWARASAKPIGFRNTGVRWGRRFEVIYDVNWTMRDENWGEYYPDLAHVSFGFETPIYGNEGIPDLSLLPQKPTQPPINEPGVRQNIANRLTERCKQYITNLLNEAARQNRKNPVVSTDLLDIFESVQKQGGFHRLPVGTRKNPSYSHVNGTIPRKNATIYLAPMKLYPDMTAGEIAQGALALDSLDTFHELTHLAGSKEYDDLQLSRAARVLGGPALPTAKTNKNLDFSKYLENELKRNCPP